jgi:hypothetical protein
MIFLSFSFYFSLSIFVYLCIYLSSTYIGRRHFLKYVNCQSLSTSLIADVHVDEIPKFFFSLFRKFDSKIALLREQDFVFVFEDFFLKYTQ